MERAPSKNHHSNLKLMLTIPSSLEQIRLFSREQTDYALAKSGIHAHSVLYYEVCDCIYG